VSNISKTPFGLFMLAFECALKSVSAASLLAPVLVLDTPVAGPELASWVGHRTNHHSIEQSRAPKP
jgi:hypothetical protein